MCVCVCVLQSRISKKILFVPETLNFEYLTKILSLCPTVNSVSEKMVRYFLFIKYTSLWIN